MQLSFGRVCRLDRGYQYKLKIPRDLGTSLSHEVFYKSILIGYVALADEDYWVNYFGVQDLRISSKASMSWGAPSTAK